MWSFELLMLHLHHFSASFRVILAEYPTFLLLEYATGDSVCVHKWHKHTIFSISLSSVIIRWATRTFVQTRCSPRCKLHSSFVSVTTFHFSVSHFASELSTPASLAATAIVCNFQTSQFNSIHNAMSGRLAFHSSLFLLLCFALFFGQDSAVEAVYAPTRGQQNPHSYGRRGLNPNVNSLFFGKRAGAEQEALSNTDMGRKCMAAMSMCNMYFESNNVNES